MVDTNSNTNDKASPNATTEKSERIKRLAEEAVMAAAQHHQLHPPRHPPPPAQQQQQASGMFGFNHNHFMGGMMRGRNPFQGAAPGINYFNPMMPSMFPHNLAAVPPPTAAATTTGSTLPLSAAMNSGKRKAPDGNDTIVQRLTKHQRPSSSPAIPQQPPPPVIDLSNESEQNKATEKAASNNVPKDPPGFEAFQRDPSFINSIMASRMNNTGHTDKLLGPLASGLVKMSDDEIFNLCNEENDSTIKSFVSGVIMPLLGIDDQIANSNYSVWQGYAHISSENLISLAKNFFYVRRCSMKSAVQVAYYEMKKNHTKILEARVNRKSSSSVDSEKVVKKIQKLESALKKQKEDNAKMTKEIEKIYENDIAEMRTDHKLHVEELKEAHRKEVEALKKEMEEMKWSHREFLASAVELAHKQGKPSLGRAISDM